MPEDSKPKLQNGGSYSIQISRTRRAERVREVIQLGEGDLLEGKYRIVGEIGSGGMGIVYEAVHTTLDTRVAVKVLLPTVTDLPNVVDRFTVEAKSAASIKHPNIVEVTDFGLTPDRRPFFVMELLTGESLADRLATRTSLPEREVVEVSDQILSGLAIAHRMGVVHRDLKPENVFMASASGGGETVKLLDFGVAKILSAPSTDIIPGEELPTGKYPELSLSKDGRGLTMHGMVLGTPGYLAPETASNKLEADARSDLFSVGVLMYEMLTGVIPFRGETVNDVLLSTIKDPISRITDMAPQVSKAMEQTIYTALAKMPEQRFQNCQEFMRHLTAAAVGRVLDDARECVTEIADVWPPTPIRKGHQDEIETMDGTTSGVDVQDVLDDRSAVKLPSYLVDGIETDRSGRLVSNDDKATKKVGARGKTMAIAIVTVLVLLLGVSLAILLTRPDPSELDPVTMQKKAKKSIIIWLEVQPRGATVLWNGVANNSRPLSLEQGTKKGVLTISAPGHVAQKIDLVPDKEKSIKVVLETEGDTSSSTSENPDSGPAE